MCDCITRINANLAEHNTALTTTMFGKPPRCVIDTWQVESGRGKKKAVAALASFCPFCGEEYKAESAPVINAETAVTL